MICFSRVTDIVKGVDNATNPLEQVMREIEICQPEKQMVHMAGQDGMCSGPIIVGM